MPLRCVIVDDNPAVLEAAGALLEGEGIAVVGVASNSAAAMEVVAALQPDLTLVDIDLGGESGFDLVRRLSRNGLPGPHRTILISTHAERDFADLIDASPALGFLSKSDLSASAILALLDDHPQ